MQTVKEVTKAGYRLYDDTAFSCLQSISLFRELQFPLKQKDTACNEDSYSEVQKKIQELQEYITDNYYVCTKEILSGLGEMYICDERFKKNIDRAAILNYLKYSCSVFYIKVYVSAAFSISVKSIYNPSNIFTLIVAINV